mgnify:CR=1 FL=1
MTNKNYEEDGEKNDQMPDNLPPESYLIAWVFIFGLFLFLAIILIAIF